MKPFEKEIMAYALQNALEFGKTDAGKMLPKLFQHGLKREDIESVVPLISEIVKKVNSMNDKERLKELENFEGIARKKVFKTKGLPALKQSEVSGRMTFRLAPFPSGALHIGNAKTYLLNALYAEEYDADLLLVIDDTIGSVEKQADKESYTLIEDGFKWLGVNYKKPVIYKSDRLEIYYKYAKEIIEKNKAYVCYCIQDELRENRARGVECSCRQFPPGIQLERWKEMFNAKEGQAVMRIKTNMADPNPAFRDRVLFKISDREHPRVGKKYRVWPTLEMSWAIDDHLLKITHILRGNELMIETEMEKYIWDIFRWKHPEVIHVGIVKLEGVVGKISKSKSTKEVKSGVYTGWDDPRTWSIQSLIRRGILKESIREFVKEIGPNKQDITVPIDSLYAINRKTLDAGTNRYFFVANPVKIEIENNLGLKEAKLLLHPDKKDMRTVKVGKNIFVSGEDWERLKGKEVRLLHLFNLILDKKTKITSIENKNIPKIHWVSDKVYARVLMPEGKWIEGFADSGIEHLRKYEVIQFERFGFVRYDGTKKGVKEFWFAHR